MFILRKLSGAMTGCQQSPALLSPHHYDVGTFITVDVTRTMWASVLGWEIQRIQGVVEVPHFVGSSCLPADVFGVGSHS